MIDDEGEFEGLYMPEAGGESASRNHREEDWTRDVDRKSWTRAGDYGQDGEIGGLWVAVHPRRVDLIHRWHARGRFRQRTMGQYFAKDTVKRAVADAKRLIKAERGKG